jgi:hypothetical protein
MSNVGVICANSLLENNPQKLQALVLELTKLLEKAISARQHGNAA